MKIAVISGKGGTGKTTFAVNFFKFLTDKKEKKVLLADLDVEEPNDNLFLNLPLSYEKSYTYIPRLVEEKCTYCRVCAKKCLFKALAVAKGFWMLFPELCHGCRACEYVCEYDAIVGDKREIGRIGFFEDESFGFAEGRLNVGEVLTTALIKDVKNRIDYKKYEIILFDAPPGTSCPVIEVVRDCDKIIVVAEDSPFGFHDYTLIHDLLKELGKSYSLVINKFEDGKDILPFVEKEGVVLAGKIPFDKNIAVTYSEGGYALEGYDELFEQIYETIMGEKS